jgi:hypothetical protein
MIAGAHTNMDPTNNTALSRGRASRAHPTPLMLALTLCLVASVRRASLLPPAASARHTVPDGAYDLQGDAPWRPVRIADDEARTVLDFPAGTATRTPPAPVVHRTTDCDRSQVNVEYAIVKRRMTVDCVLLHATLFDGVGANSSRIHIKRLPVEE